MLVRQNAHYGVSKHTKNSCRLQKERDYHLHFTEVRYRYEVADDRVVQIVEEADQQGAGEEDHVVPQERVTTGGSDKLQR
jgi:hypothetical protein